MEPNFDRDSGEGQLCRSEREALYKLVRDSKPGIVCEVGTWKGGGSTYFISSALHENGHGTLYTCENDMDFYRHAVKLYSGALARLSPHIVFNLGKSHEIYPDILKYFNHVDIVMLDGEENPDQTVREYEMFFPYMLTGSYLVCHDWKESKMEKLKPILDYVKTWETVVSLDDTATGFRIFRRK